MHLPLWRNQKPKALIVGAPTTVVPSAMPVTTVGPASTQSPTIVFHLTPPEATLTIDGNGLPLEKREIARPAAGATLMVVARAPQHEDVTILVDYFTTSPLELSLKSVAGADTPTPAPVAKPDDAPKPEQPAAKAEPPAGGGGAAAAPKRPDAPRGRVQPPPAQPPRTDPGSPSLPANPY
jgi:hypothetical protein